MGSFETDVIYFYCVYLAPVGWGAARAKDTDLRTICNKWKLSQKEKRAEHVTSGNAYLRVRRNNKKGQKPRRRSRRT